MQNYTTSTSTTLDARIDALISDLCQLALDERSGDTSEERERLFDAVQNELLELARQRSAAIVATPEPAPDDASEDDPDEVQEEPESEWRSWLIDAED